MHRPYEELTKRKADFRVKYKFKDPANGGRKQLPFQGYRCDFCYTDDFTEPAYTIFPEFEDEGGNIILIDNKRVPKQGIARMWIVNLERKFIHQERIKIGTKCFFREGAIMSAECEVIEIIDLFKDPVAGTL